MDTRGKRIGDERVWFVSDFTGRPGRYGASIDSGGDVRVGHTPLAAHLATGEASGAELVEKPVFCDVKHGRCFSGGDAGHVGLRSRVWQHAVHSLLPRPTFLTGRWSVGRA